MMKIALIRQEQTGTDGGAQAIIDLMLRSLSQYQHLSLSLLCRRWSGIAFDSDMIEKIIINPQWQGRKKKQQSFNAAVKDHLSQNTYDLIQSHERFDGCHIFRAGDGVHKIWLKRKAAIMKPLQKWWMFRSAYHKALLAEEKRMFESNSLKKVICNSHLIKQEILDNFSISEDKICVIYNGVDHKQYSPSDKPLKNQLRQTYNIPTDALVFIFPGSGFERKNLSSVLTAFTQLGNNCHLLVIGRDKKLARYQKYAKKSGCESRVTFLGAQERSEMPTFYQLSDVLVLPSLYDPFPNAILEGLASGLPCITSTACGASDIIPRYTCGATIEALDTDALVKEMQRYQEKSILDKEAKIAHEVSLQFTSEKMQQELLQLYDQLLETPQ